MSGEVPHVAACDDEGCYCPDDVFWGRLLGDDDPCAPGKDWVAAAFGPLDDEPEHEELGMSTIRTNTLTVLLRRHRPDGWSCSCGWPLDDSVGSWVDHLAAEIEPLMRCPVADPTGSPCRLHADHDGQHGDGLGTVWDGPRVPSTSEGEGT